MNYCTKAPKIKFDLRNLFIWLFGWLGVVGIVLFLLGAWGYAKSGAKPGPVGRFIERLGFHDDEK